MPQPYGAAGTSNVSDRDWQPYSRHPLVIGSGDGVEVARRMLHEMRRRKRPREWVWRITAGFLTLLVHAVALTVMALVQPAGSGTGTGTSASNGIAVRLINAPAPPAAAPPPPPVELPQRAPSKAARPNASAGRHVAATAMPPVSLPTPLKPQITVVPVKPQVTVTPPVVEPSHTPVHAEIPPAIVPPPLKVVEEVSRMALPVPEAPTIQLAEPEKLQSQLAPIAVPSLAPRVTVATPTVHVNVPVTVAASPAMPAPVEATPPPLPAVDVAPPPIRVERTAPSVAPVRVEAPAPNLARVAPVTVPDLPPVPDAVAAPTVTLPAAQVPAHHAPKVTAPVELAPPPAVVAKTQPESPPIAAQARSRANRETSASSSWVTSGQQFDVAPLLANPPAAAPGKGGREGSVQLAPHGNSDVMRRGSDRLGYAPTIFEQYWAPFGESSFDTFLSRLVDKLTLKHTFTLAPGIRLHCRISPTMFFLGCGVGDGPRPTPGNADDERLHMAPARQLVPDIIVSAPAQPTTASGFVLDNKVRCEAAKVAGSPPPPGCPGGPPLHGAAQTHP